MPKCVGRIPRLLGEYYQYLSYTLRDGYSHFIRLAFITGLRPTGEAFYPYVSNEDTINFDHTREGFGHYIENHNNKASKEMLDAEHITFLALWLSRCVFCSKSMKVAKKFITITNQLHEGRNLCLIQMILGSLYENLGMVVATLNNITPETNFLLARPF